MTNLDDKRLARIAKYRASIPEIYQPVYDKATLGKSYAAAVKARCLDCCCWQRVEVTQCPAVECPLWAKRPYQKAPQSEKPCENDEFTNERNRSDDNGAPEQDRQKKI
jgi:hypothetical protein